MLNKLKRDECWIPSADGIGELAACMIFFKYTLIYRQTKYKVLSPTLFEVGDFEQLCL